MDEYCLVRRRGCDDFELARVHRLSSGKIYCYYLFDKRPEYRYRSFYLEYMVIETKPLIYPREYMEQEYMRK
jgi:hypothetical protein